MEYKGFFHFNERECGCDLICKCFDQHKYIEVKANGIKLISTVRSPRGYYEYTPSRKRDASKPVREGSQSDCRIRV